MRNIIALDAMGGDFAPEAIVKGAIMTIPELHEQLELLLVGQEERIKGILDAEGYSNPRLKIFDAPEIIEMGEHPTKALQQKQNSSIAVGFGLMAAGKVHAFCSAGNTGAMMVGAMFSVKAIPGIIRPAIASNVPKTDGGMGLILDVGANAECKPEMLEQFALMGQLYAENVLGIEQPMVGLLNLGEEETKGNTLTQATYQLLKSNSQINFAGNLEGRDIFDGRFDVIVTDGFSGNIVLKMAESMYDICLALGDDPGKFFTRLNYEDFGGSPIIGVNGNVIIGHGVSTPNAVKNMVLQSQAMIEADFHTKLGHLILPVTPQA